MSFNLSNIVNNFLNVRNKVKDVDGNWVDQTQQNERQYFKHSVGLSVVGELPLFEEWNKKIIIDSFEWGTDTRHQVYPRLFIREGSSGRADNQIFLALSGSPAIWDATQSYIYNQEHDYFVSAVYDEDAGRYKSILKRPIILPNGGKLTFNSGSDSEGYTLAYKVVYRIIEG